MPRVLILSWNRAGNARLWGKSASLPRAAHTRRHRERLCERVERILAIVQFQHTVEDMDGHIYFGRPASVRTRAQAVTDHLLDLNLPMAASARARFVYPEAFCQLARPCSAMN